MRRTTPVIPQITRCLRTNLSLSATRYASLTLLGGACVDVDVVEELEVEDEFLGYRTQPSKYLLRLDDRDEFREADGAVVPLLFRLPIPAMPMFILALASRFDPFQGFINRPAFAFHDCLLPCSENEDTSSTAERGYAAARDSEESITKTRRTVLKMGETIYATMRKKYIDRGRSFCSASSRVNEKKRIVVSPKKCECGIKVSSSKKTEEQTAQKKRQN